MKGKVYIEAPLSDAPLSPEAQKILDRLLVEIDKFKVWASTKPVNRPL